MTRFHKFATVTSIGVTLMAGPAGACFIHALGKDGMSVPHPGALSVAAALNKAQNDGLLTPLPSNPDARMGRLMVMNWMIRSSLESMADGIANGPPVSVLLTQSGAWFRFNDPEVGIAFHVDPPEDGERVMLIPDTAISAVFAGEIGVHQLHEAGIVRIFADSSTDVLAQFESSIATRVSQRSD